MTNEQIHSGAAEQAMRYRAQRLLDLGQWIECKASSLHLVSQVLTEHIETWVSTENTSMELDEAMGGMGHAIDLLRDLSFELMRLERQEPETAPNELVLKHSCGHDSKLQLPTISEQ